MNNALNNERVLTISSHCDDESFGCLGALLKHKAEGAEFAFIWYTEARNTFEGAQKCLEYFNAKTYWRFLRFRDQQLDTYPLTDLMAPIEALLEKFKPTIVYMPFIGDLNRDHRLVSEAAMVACRPYKANSPNEVYMYQIPGSTELGLRLFKYDMSINTENSDKTRLLREWYPNEQINGREDPFSLEHFESWPKRFHQ